MWKQLILVSFILLSFINVIRGEKWVPKRPIISSSFTARVRGSLFNPHVSANSPSFYGGGLFAFHEDKGFKRFNINLRNNKSPANSSLYIHNLDRHDLQYSFKVEYNNTCTKRDLNEQIINPFDWVQFANFTGESSYNGHSLHVWEYTNEKKEYYKLSVKKGTNIPVVIVLGNELVSMEGMKFEMVVLEWSTFVKPRLLSYVPMKCGPTAEHLLGDVNGVVDFADNNWNCADPNCDQTVPEGSGQPDYACAEFVARSLAAGGFIPGLGPLDDQGSYSSYNYGGNTYSLIWCSSLSDALNALGFTSESPQAGSVNAGCAAFGDGGDGDWSHAVIGVSPGVDDAHNNARYHLATSSNLYAGIDAVQCPPGQTPGTSSGSTSGSGTYYSTQNEKEQEQGGRGSIYGEDSKEFKIKSIDAFEEVRMVEEKVNKKF